MTRSGSIPANIVDDVLGKLVAAQLQLARIERELGGDAAQRGVGTRAFLSITLDGMFWRD